MALYSKLIVVCGDEMSFTKSTTWQPLISPRLFKWLGKFVAVPEVYALSDSDVTSSNASIVTVSGEQ